LAFPDDELDPAPRGAATPRGRPPGGNRDIFVRRIIALVVGVGILIILMLLVRACLDSRKERGFENYVSDVNSAINGSRQIAANFFLRLQDPPRNTDATTLEGQIASDRVGAESNLQQVEGVDTPDELAGPQVDLVKSFELRRDALSVIAEQIPTALGEEGRNDALDAIAEQMRVLLASDVLFAEARAEINTLLEEQGIGTLLEDSLFLPDDSWLSEDQVVLVLNNFAADAGAVEPGTHGVELVSATVNNETLTEGTENTIELDGPLTVEATVLNSGTAEELDIEVTAEISGPTGLIEGEGSIPRLDVGDQEEVEIRIDQDPPTRAPLNLEVKAQGVFGETLFDNNTIIYTVTFE
jgi:hypothetical protein